MTETMTVEEFRAQQKKGNKFGAKPVTIDNIRFDSGVEGERYRQLLLLLKSGQIQNLQIKAPKIEILPAFTDRYQGRHKATYYIPDFTYEEGGVFVVEDVKGGHATRTALFELKRKIVLSHYPQYDFRIITM